MVIGLEHGLDLDDCGIDSKMKRLLSRFQASGAQRNQLKGSKEEQNME
jgi:hypothetical protein